MPTVKSSLPVRIVKYSLTVAILACLASTADAQCQSGQCRMQSVLVNTYTPPVVADSHTYQETHVYSGGCPGGHGRAFMARGPVRRAFAARPLRRAAGAVLAWRPFGRIRGCH
jgi:hypothetical protein